MKGYPRFILRTVRNGRIKFDNAWWQPIESTVRLDGLRFAFGVYVEGKHSSPVRRLDTLCLWGTEKAYNAVNEEAYEKACEEEALLLAPDGYLRQYWWSPIK